MNLVARFYDVQRGSVLVDGTDVRLLTQADLRQRIGLVHQDVFLFTGDIKGNIRLNNRNIPEEAVDRAAKIVNADSFIRALPAGYMKPPPASTQKQSNSSRPPCES